MTFTRAPRTPVAADGAPAFGAHLGAVDRLSWRGLAGPHARGRLWRLLHHKRWHYAGIVGPRVIAAVAVVDVGYAANAFCYLFDRQARVLRADRSLIGVPLLSARVSDRPDGAGRSWFRVPGVALSVERVSDAWRVRARVRGLSLDATLDARHAPPTLCAIAPIDGGLANCTHKTMCLPVQGYAVCQGQRFDLADHYGAIDHTNGLVARETRWRWASANGRGIGLNLVVGFNGPVENVFWIGDEVHAAGPVEMMYDAQAPGERPWRIRSVSGGAVDLSFHPEGARRQHKDLVLAASRYVQPFGRFSGVLRPPGGPEVRVEDLPGVTEDHEARW